MHFDELINKARDSVSNNSFIIPKEWSQGRTAFGGLLAAMICTTMQSMVNNERLLRSIKTTFANPITMDTPFGIEVVLLREGRTVTHMEGRAVQSDKTVVIVLASFGIPRDSDLSIDAVDAPVLPPPEKGIVLPEMPNVIIPDFIKHFDFRWVTDDLPFTGSQNSQVVGWIRFSEEPAQFTDSHLIALIDAWPVGMILMLDKPAPSSTLSWNIELIHPHSVAPDEWLLYKAEIQHAEAGYAYEKASI
ncbi:MAG: thioesterase family protein, partial [candidate division Zixibacteria bacterium]|nr:thioesterase family protein [candidate division Zixibacteria bacterium]